MNMLLRTDAPIEERFPRKESGSKARPSIVKCYSALCHIKPLTVMLYCTVIYEFLTVTKPSNSPLSAMAEMRSCPTHYGVHAAKLSPMVVAFFKTAWHGAHLRPNHHMHSSDTSPDFARPMIFGRRSHVR